MPFGQITLKGSKPKPYPAVPTTLGDHLKKRRYELSLLQKDVAARVGVTADTVLNWEHNRCTPSVRCMPRLIAFLGYDPHPHPKTLSEQIIAKRRQLGIARKRLAWGIGVEENTLRSLEIGKAEPTGDQRDLIDWFLAAPLEDIEAVVPPPGRLHAAGLTRSHSSVVEGSR